MSIKNTQEWFREAVPNPDNHTLSVQLGCHFEEVAEMLEAVYIRDNSGDSPLWGIALDAIESLADALKFGQCHIHGTNKKMLLDAIGDQIVTATGVGTQLGMDVAGALDEINRSNWSKFEDGRPVFNENGKIAKGKDYTPPNLEPFL